MVLDWLACLTSIIRALHVPRMRSAVDSTKALSVSMCSPVMSRSWNQHRHMPLRAEKPALSSANRPISTFWAMDHGWRVK